MMNVAITGDAGRHDGSANLEVRLKSMTWVVPGVLRLRFTSLDGGLLPSFEPGAHIDVHLDDAVRQYSLCGDPDDRSAYEIAVREVEGGRASQAIHRSLRPGIVVKIGMPRNNFPFEASENYLFVAGGIGVTPLLPMMLAAGRAGANWSLVFCTRRKAEAPFLDEILELGGEVSVYASDRGERFEIATSLEAVRPQTKLYCCGPSALMTAVEEATAGWPSGSVCFEWFAARTRPDGESSKTLQIVCSRSGLTLSVPSEKSILTVLHEAGIDVPRSCEQGVCGTCEVRVLEGEVDHRDSILSEAEQATNEVMMTCVSRARSAKLVLDL